MSDGSVHVVMTCERCPWTATERSALLEYLGDGRDHSPVMDKAYAAMMAHGAECPGGR